ncbi:MAG TPA: DUF302 domain-containing protein [Chitinophagaceae bacterium]|nr:DUF302 domain-containing protein [Chitinophagaceae bacterium]
MNPNGVVVFPSHYSVKETIDRLQAFLLQRGVTIYARIDQQAEVNNTGQNLLPLEFIMFGNPKVGGLVMAENPMAALDLPLKAIAWQDAQQHVWIACNDVIYLQQRFGLPGALIAPLDITTIVAKALE